MLTERFIQDALSKGQRLASILKKADPALGWTFGGTDLVYQEFSFDGERPDIIATFDGGSHLLLAETKGVTAGPEELDQLLQYLKKWKELCRCDDLLKNVKEAVSILAAPNFFENLSVPPEFDGRVFLVQFKFDGRHSPFRVVRDRPADDSCKNDTRRAQKMSQIATIRAHMIKLENDEVRDRFQQLADLFFEQEHPWVFANVKSDGVKVNYKGQEVVWIQRRGKCFSFGYHHSDGTYTASSDLIKVPGCDQHWLEIRDDIRKTLMKIDANNIAGIPPEFDWSTCE